MIREQIISRRAGVYTRVKYRTDMTSKLSAASKKAGYTVEKITETTVRIGCDYNHMKAVVERRAASDTQKPYNNPYEWVVPNRIKKHKTNGTEYVVFGTVPNANSSSIYIIRNGNDVRTVTELTENDKNLFINSAFSKSPSDVIMVKMDNMLSVC